MYLCYGTCSSWNLHRVLNQKPLEITTLQKISSRYKFPLLTHAHTQVFWNLNFGKRQIVLLLCKVQGNLKLPAWCNQGWLSLGFVCIWVSPYICFTCTNNTSLDAIGILASLLIEYLILECTPYALLPTSWTEEITTKSNVNCLIASWAQVKSHYNWSSTFRGSATTDSTNLQSKVFTIPHKS